jgi:hypothetical protein
MSFPRILSLGCLGLALALAAASPASAVTLNLSTGLDNTNTVISSGDVADAYWTASANGGAALTVFPNNADWFGGWVANSSQSDWIANNPNVTDQGPTPYTFTRTFDLTGVNLSTVSLSGGWTLDDQGTLDLNGNNLGTLGDGNWGSLSSFSALGTDGFFNQGVNTLTMTITDSDRFLEGVDLQGTLTGRSLGAPEPSPLLGLLIPTLFVGVLALRRRAPAA